MPNPNPKRYTRVVSVPLTDDQAARLDAGVGAGATRSDLIRAAIDAHLDESPSVHTPSPGLPDIEQALERVLARHGIGSDKKPSPGRLASAADMKALRGRLSGGAQPEVQPKVQQQENRAEIPEGWAPATIDTDALHALQERASGYASALVEFDSAGRGFRNAPGMHAWDGQQMIPLEFDQEDEARVTIDGYVYTITKREAKRRRSVQHRAG